LLRSIVRYIPPIAGALLLSFATTVTSLAQANVVENEPVVVYVDQAVGHDTNPGTVLAPYQTIKAGLAKAIAANQTGVGAKIVINPGTYRDVINLTSTWKQTSAPITFQAAIAGTVILSGADQYTGWSYTSKAGVYQHSWTTIGVSPVPNGFPSTLPKIAYRREEAFVNGTMLTQVMQQAQVAPGTFYVDDTAGQIYLAPAAGTNIQTADVELTRRSNIFTISHRQNVVVRGLSFIYAMASMDASPININSSNNILFDQVQANWNGWTGLGVHGTTNVTIQNSVFSHNSGQGFNGARNVNLLLLNDETDQNGWRSAQASFYDYAMGGTKFFNEHATQVKGLKAFHNYAQGLWFDTDNRDIVIDGAQLIGNFNPNLQIELNVGPITLTNSLLCYGGVGLNLINASHLTVTKSSFIANGGTGPHEANIYLAGKAGGRSFTDWQTGIYHNVISSNLTFEGNTVLDVGPSQEAFSSYFTGTDWWDFQSTLTSNQNVWFDSAKTNPFIQYGKTHTLASWQQMTGQDQGSTWGNPTMINPAVSCSLPTVSTYDFQIFSDAPFGGRSYQMSGGHVQAALQLYEYQSDRTAPSAPFSSFQLSTVGLPSGVSATFSPATTNARGLAFTLNLTAASWVPAQTSFVTVLATHNGLVRTLTFPVYIP
jgi:hypothetical protein